MTKKRFRKLLRAHFTKFYMQNRNDLNGWISKAYRAARDCTADNYEWAYIQIKCAIPVK